MKIKSKKVVILGASGFIGGSTYIKLKNKNINCIGFSSKDTNLVTKKGLKNLERKLDHGDSIIFISAIAPCKNEQMYRENVIMLKNFFNTVENININHIVYISSDAVYGDSMKLIREKYKKNPNNFHGQMHAKREKDISFFCKKQNISLSILRPTLVYGPGDTHNGYGPNQFLRAINKGKNIELFGNGEEMRDHIFIDDLVNVISTCIDKCITGSYTVATGKVISFYEIAKIICRIKRISPNKIVFNKREGPMPHNGYRAFDISLLNKNFPNLIFTDMEQGISKSIDYLI